MIKLIKKYKFVILDTVFGLGAYVLAWNVDFRIGIALILYDISRLCEMKLREDKIEYKNNLKFKIFENSILSAVAKIIYEKDKDR